jgi:hypothetical protein
MVAHGAGPAAELCRLPAVVLMKGSSVAFVEAREVVGAVSLIEPDH